MIPKKASKIGHLAASTLAVLGLSANIFPGVVSAANSCSNEVWNDVMARGELVVGVKADYQPWGFRDEKGALVGMEVDIAEAAAAAMGVKLKLEVVQSSNRMQRLTDGAVDMFIATMSDRADRRKLVGIVQPNHYTSGTNIMSPKALAFEEWEDLRGKTVCGKQNAFYNEVVTERYGVDMITFDTNEAAKDALKAQQCVAWVYDGSAIVSDLTSGQFEDFEMPLVSEDPNPWAIAVPLPEVDCILGNFMSGLVFKMHQRGTLIELEEKWGINRSQFLIDKQTAYGDWLRE